MEVPTPREAAVPVEDTTTERARLLDLDPTVDPRTPEGGPAPQPEELRAKVGLKESKVPPCSARRAREILKAAGEKRFDLSACTVSERRACLLVMGEARTREEIAALFSKSRRTIELDYRALDRRVGRETFRADLEEVVGDLVRSHRHAYARVVEKDPLGAVAVKRALVDSLVKLGVVVSRGKQDSDFRVTVEGRADAVGRTVKLLAGLDPVQAGLEPARERKLEVEGSARTVDRVEPAQLPRTEIEYERDPEEVPKARELWKADEGEESREW